MIRTTTKTICKHFGWHKVMCCTTYTYRFPVTSSADHHWGFNWEHLSFLQWPVLLVALGLAIWGCIFWFERLAEYRKASKFNYRPESWGEFFDSLDWLGCAAVFLSSILLSSIVYGLVYAVIKFFFWV